MSIEVNLSESGRTLYIAVYGEFNSRNKKEINDLVEKYGPDMSYHFDFSNTTHVRSDGVGMLINMRQAMGGMNANINLTNCGDGVRDIFCYAGLQGLFSITRPVNDEEMVAA